MFENEASLNEIVESINEYCKLLNNIEDKQSNIFQKQ